MPARVKHLNADETAILARAGTIINRRDWEDDNQAGRSAIRMWRRRLEKMTALPKFPPRCCLSSACTPDCIYPRRLLPKSKRMSTKMHMKILRAPLLAIALVGASTIASHAVDPTGTWLTDEGKATVRVSDCGGALCATIVSLREPNDPQTGRPKTDIYNVDASKRNRPIVGVQVLISLRPQGANKWSGQVYNPEDGKTYDGNVVLENANILKVQGCVLFLCETKTWTRKG
jgi:uncharacterized protein (DUF2147 family)